MNYRFALVLGCVFSTLGFAQSFEASVSGGVARFGSSANLGTATGLATDPQYVMKDGFSLSFRMTINSWRFMGHEIGYSYNHTSLDRPPTANGPGIGQPLNPATTDSVPMHQGFYDFLVYATPEGTKIRPFAAGGVQFSSFVPPGTSVSYGNQVTKYGINYGGGIKVRLNDIWGIRFDARFYNMGKPFNLAGQTGRLIQQQYSAGLSFNL